MVAYAELFEPEVSSDPSPFGSAVAVAVEDDGADADRLLLASTLCSGEQGRATFTGYVADNETGLCYARNRMYGPTLGRFINRDNNQHIWNLPAAGDGHQDGHNLYMAYFVPNRLDPEGLACGNWIVTPLAAVPGFGIPGFEVRFVDARPTCCPCGTIRVVQSLKSSGAWGSFAHVDAKEGPGTVRAKHLRTKGGVPIPAYTADGAPQGAHGPLSFYDAPDASARFGKGTVFSMEATAICTIAGVETEVGSTTYSWDDATEKLDYPGAGPILTPFGIGFTKPSDAPGTIYNDAKKAWVAEGGSSVP